MTNTSRAVLGIVAALAALGSDPSFAAAQAASVEVAFIANAQDATVALLDVAARAVIGKIDVNPTRVKAVGPGAPNYAQDTDGKFWPVLFAVGFPSRK